ncbi:MAG: flagellar hook-length control protein FliK [Pseudorhodoplanes sp.]|nr:flagellar hook-length control protein FliK [Pseudorhodoplanes sp.]
MPAPAKPEAAARPQSEAEAPRHDWRSDHQALDPKPHADPAQSANIATAHASSAHAATGAQANAQPQQAAPVVPLAGLAVEIAAQARAGKNRFEIRLDPPELGRIDVRLDVDREGNVTSRLVVERAETLDLLRRDAHALERALNQAGLKTSDNALQFSLRDQNGSQNQNGQETAGGERVVIGDEEGTLAAPVRGYGLLLGQGKGLDIRI